MRLIVRVVQASDEFCDETKVGRLGVITDASIFCDHLFVLVRFSDGSRDGFWSDELQVVR